MQKEYIIINLITFGAPNPEHNLPEGRHVIDLLTVEYDTTLWCLLEEYCGNGDDRITPEMGYSGRLQLLSCAAAVLDKLVLPICGWAGDSTPPHLQKALEYLDAQDNSAEITEELLDVLNNALGNPCWSSLGLEKETSTFGFLLKLVRFAAVLQKRVTDNTPMSHAYGYDIVREIM